MYDPNGISLIEQMLPLLKADESDISNEYYNTARQFKKFLDTLPGGFFIYNADGDEQIIYANRALIRIFKCDTLEEFKELTGNSFKGIVYAEDLDAVEKSIAEQIARSHDELDFVEYRIMCKDGTLRWVEDYGHYVRTQHLGNIFYVFISDATEKINKKNSERTALINEKNEKEKKLKSLIEQYDKERQLIYREHLQRLEVIEGLSINYESILYIDLDSDKMLPYRLSTRLKQQFNRKLEVQDYSPYVKNYVREWVHPEDKERVADLLSSTSIREKLKDNQSFYFNYRSIENGTTKNLQLRLVNVGGEGNVSQIVMGCRNIDEEILQQTEQKRLLEEALNNANLASVAKNTFLSNMSHDMRTPLNAIFGYTALAKKNMRDKKAVQDFLEKIDSAGRQILELVDKVLEISYIESKDFKITENPCDIVMIAEDIFRAIEPEAQKKNIQVEFDCGNVDNSLVYADDDKLRQILSHIAGNAVKYTGGGGKITFIIDEKRSHSSEFATFNFIMKDTGVGIDKHSLERIFEPFEREKNSTHSGIFGSGLGLTIAKRIVKLMGGDITAQSAVGEGSTFTVTISLRLQNPDALKNGSRMDIHKQLKGKKILLVEDNDINLEIETEMLEDIGLKVEPAVNGKIAVEKVAKAKPGEYMFVLMDIQMPVMDGRQAAEAIRNLDNPDLANIPIIALSANAFESDRRMSIDKGMDAHLTKPIDIPLLLQTIEQVVRKK